MPQLFLSAFAPDEGMSDEWGLFLAGPTDELLCRIEGKYLIYKKTIEIARPEDDIRYKDRIPLGTIKKTYVPHFREILIRLEVNNHASFSSSHDFVRKALERMEKDEILDTSTLEFQNALEWIKKNYDDAGD